MADFLESTIYLTRESNQYTMIFRTDEETEIRTVSNFHEVLRLVTQASIHYIGYHP